MRGYIKRIEYFFKTQRMLLLNKVITQKLICCSIILCWSSFTQAQESTQESITDQLQISGNKRTKTSYIKKLVRICYKDIERGRFPSLPTGEAQLEQCLTNQGLFSEVTVQRLSTTEISIRVKDKWSFLGIPSYQRGEEPNEAAWGAFIFDSNIGGTGSIFGSSFRRQISEQRDSYSFFYGIPYVDAQGDYGLFISTSSNDITNYQFDADDWIYRSNEKSNSISLRLRQYITPEFSMSYSYTINSFESGSNELRNGTQLADELTNFDSQSFELNYEWSNLDAEYYYQKGFRISQSLLGDFDSDDGKIRNSVFSTDIYWGLPSYGKNVFQLNLEGATQDSSNAYDSFKIGNGAGSRGISSGGGWARQYTTVGLEYQIPIIGTRSVFWTISPFVDYGYLWDVPNVAEENFDYIAWGIASYIYPRQISVPALGIFYGSNNRFQETSFSFFIGFRV